MTEAMAKIEPGASVARGIANRLVYRVAAQQSGAQCARYVIALSLLGFDALARRIATRLGAVSVTVEGTNLLVKAPYSPDFNHEVRTVRGAWWDRSSNVRVVPVSAKVALWGALRAAFPGSLVVGSRISVAS